MVIHYSGTYPYHVHLNVHLDTENGIPPTYTNNNTNSFQIHIPSSVSVSTRFHGLYSQEHFNNISAHEMHSMYRLFHAIILTFDEK